jgi:hypothetical protein
LDELRDFANRRNIGQKLVGGGVRGAATRGLLGMDAPENATPIQREVYENAARMSAPAQGLTALKAATVFHGSPHKFTKFDPKKIGTGEGAQAYGHGMYVAESPEVAGQYRKQLAPGFTRTVDDVAFDASNPQHLAASYMQMFGKRGKSPAEIAKILNEGGHKEAAQLVLSGKKLGQMGEQAKGSLYKIDLPDEAIARMLDWDKPLSQQKELKDVFNKINNEISLPKLQDAEGAGFAYQALANAVGGQANASALLRSYGIPGIRYLDQGSRGQGQGTSNFVVFPKEEELLRILERNGVPIQSLLD